MSRLNQPEDLPCQYHPERLRDAGLSGAVGCAGCREAARRMLRVFTDLLAETTTTNRTA